MAQIKIKNLTFRYPLEEKIALKNISLSIDEGEYVVLCGKSGCGKTTLLKHLKTVLAPKGKKEGEIILQTDKIGFVMQDPENQIVTDKVWHELAFGLENMGLKSNEITVRMAEMATFFGIEEWIDKKTNELSGGQKQMLNLASIMAMHPEILILDEPTSQLDPVSAETFLTTLDRINKELGVTVIITEHRLEEIFPVADKVVVMDDGEIVAVLSPSEIGKLDIMKSSLPSAMRIYSEIRKGDCPVTVREGRKWLREILDNQVEEIKKEEKKKPDDFSVEIRDVFFRYSKNGEDILKDISLKIPEGEIFAITGGNGAGKSTLLKIIANTEVPYKGKVKIPKNLRIAALPQDVKLVFTEKTVELNLKKICSSYEKIKEVAELMGIENLLSKHPYDLSGGESQKAATAMLLLKSPDIMLFDEPTKGLDNDFKEEFAGILRLLKSKGKTIVMVSHDIEFLANHADYCAMVFDGKISSYSMAREFFLSNVFYTTYACRIARGIIKNALTCEDVIECLKAK